MKKKLTVNTLAFGNLKHRKKQYAIMIIGIILAMVFSCSMILYFFSSYEALDKEYQNNYGRQDLIASAYGKDETVFKEAKHNGRLADYGVAHILGSVCAADRDYNVPVAWLDEKAKDFSNICFVDGTYPVNENEIALEQTVLARLGIDAAVGDEIKLSFKVQNGDELFEADEKTYVLSGIVSDKFSNITRFSPSDTEYVPGGFAAQNTAVDIGGREKITIYGCIPKTPNAFEKFCRSFDETNNNGDLVYPLNFFTDNPNENARPANILYESNNMYIAILIAALIAAAGVTIINAFNTNLSDRKKQIGMLRAVGTTKKQIFSIFGREAFFISLICVPVSIAFSYLAVWLIFKISGTELVMTKSIWVLPVSAVLGMVIVMLSALIPLAHAASITPMQAIRDIEKSRKMKTKKIKTRKSFEVSTLLAKRSLAFSKASQISVSVILIATIVFSCLGFSYISYEKANPYEYNFDYSISDYRSFLNMYSNDRHPKGGFTETEFQDIASIPYISDAYGKISICVNLQIDEYSDFFKCFNEGEDFESKLYGEWGGDYSRLTYENYYDAFFSDYSESYLNRKRVLGEEKETISLDLNAYDEKVLEQLTDKDIEGEINMDKIIAGEEVILLAPQKLEYSVSIGKRGTFASYNLFDGEKPEKDYQIIFDADCPYSVGDTLDLTIAVSESTDDYGNPIDAELIHKQVKIGAIIAPKTAQDLYISQGIGFKLLTATQGMNSFMNGVNYDQIQLFTDTEVDENIEKNIRDELESFETLHDTSVVSGYEEQKRQQDSNTSIYYSLLALITICFVICASIVNNTLSARIRESKKQIGTIRAFGANQTDLIKSYFRQMMSMVSVGILSGFAVYTIGFFAVNIYNKSQGRNIDLIFDPWLTLVFCVVLVAICTANLWLKVHKEMKNSIIENIREL